MICEFDVLLTSPCEFSIYFVGGAQTIRCDNITEIVDRLTLQCHKYHAVMSEAKCAEKYEVI